MYSYIYIYIYIICTTYIQSNKHNIRHRAPRHELECSGVLRAQRAWSLGPWDWKSLRDPREGFPGGPGINCSCLRFQISIIFLIAFWHRFWPPLGPILEPTWPHLGLQNRSKRDPRAIQNAFKFVSYLWYPFGPIFCGFWIQLRPPETTKIIEKPMVF